LPGKFWTRDEETVLKQLIAKGESAESIAAKLGKTTYGVYSKANRLGLTVLVDDTKSDLSSTPIQIPPELPTAEEALKMLAGALHASMQSGLSKVEVERLQVVATLARTYDHLLANYIRYREIETKLMELERKYEQLAQETQNNVSTRNDPSPAQNSAH